MADEKELQKNDLRYIANLDKRINYGKVSNLKVIHDELDSKKVFKTNVGKRYMNKLKQIVDGTSSDTCLFCGSTLENPTKSVLCSSCATKLLPLNSNNSEKKAPKQSAGDEKKSQIPLQSVDKAVNLVTNNKNIKKAANTAKEIAEEAQKRTNEFTTKNNLDKKIKSSLAKKAIPIALILLVIAVLSAIGLETVFAFCSLIGIVVLIYDIIKKKPKKLVAVVTLVFLILTGVAGSLGGIFSGSLGETFNLSGSVKNDKDAQKLINSLYPESAGWAVEGPSNGSYIHGDFANTPVGRTTEYARQQIEQSQEAIQEYYVQEECWIFSVHKLGPNMAQGGSVLVSQRGEVLAMGVFEDFPLNNVYFRVK